MKLKEKEDAVSLRKKGFSYEEISEKISVAKSTLSFWLRDIPLSPKMKKRLLDKQSAGRYKGARTQYNRRIRRTERIVEESLLELDKLMNDPFFIAGLMLYWAEGSDDKMERIKFSNSDPAMIRLMMRWFRRYCRVPSEKFRAGLHIHSLHCRKNIESFWSKTTGIPMLQFQKTVIKPTSLKHRTRILYNGTCNIIVSDRDLYRRMYGWRLGYIKKLKLSKKADKMSL